MQRIFLETMTDEKPDCLDLDNINVEERKRSLTSPTMYRVLQERVAVRYTAVIFSLPTENL